MNLLVSHCNSERIDLFGLSFHRMESGESFWVDLRDAGLDRDVDVGFTGMCRARDVIYIGVQSVYGGKILVLDQRLNYLETLRLRHAEDVHSMAVCDNRLYVTSTRNNAVIRVELGSREESVFWQQDRYLHLNDVKFYQGECYLLSQDSPGEGKNTGGTVTRLGDGATIITGLDQPHSLWFEGNSLTVLSSRKGDVKRIDLTTLEVTPLAHLDGYLRGIWCEDGKIYIGASAERIHSRKQGPAKSFVDDLDAYLEGQQGESSLYVLDLDGRRLATTPLSTLNFEVYDLLALAQPPAANRLLARPEIVKAHFIREQRAQEKLALAGERPPATEAVESSLPPPLAGPRLGLYLQHIRRFATYADDRDRFVRGAWYFSDGWPVNFWSHVEAGKAYRELASIKSMGFNTVFIPIPWRGFQPDMRSTACCRRHRKRARALLRACDKLGLRERRARSPQLAFLPVGDRRTEKAPEP